MDEELKHMKHLLHRTTEERRKQQEAERKTWEERQKTADEKARLAWLESPNRKNALAKSLPALEAKLKPLVGESRKGAKGKVYKLPTTARQLALVAEGSKKSSSWLSISFRLLYRNPAKKSSWGKLNPEAETWVSSYRH